MTGHAGCESRRPPLLKRGRKRTRKRAEQSRDEQVRPNPWWPPGPARSPTSEEAVQVQCIGVCSADGGREVPKRDDRVSAVAFLLVDGPEAVANGKHILVAALSPHGQMMAHTEVLPSQSRLSGPSKGDVCCEGPCRGGRGWEGPEHTLPTVAARRACIEHRSGGRRQRVRPLVDVAVAGGVRGGEEGSWSGGGSQILQAQECLRRNARWCSRRCGGGRRDGRRGVRGSGRPERWPFRLARGTGGCDGLRRRPRTLVRSALHPRRGHLSCGGRRGCNRLGRWPRTLMRSGALCPRCRHLSCCGGSRAVQGRGANGGSELNWPWLRRRISVQNVGDPHTTPQERVGDAPGEVARIEGRTTGQS